VEVVDERPYELRCSDRSTAWIYDFGLRMWGRDEPRTTQLVLIGTGTDPGALRKELDACRAGGTQDPADDRSMWGILRYVRGPERTADQRDPDEQEPDRWDLGRWDPGRWDPDQQDPVE
ncbi:GTP-binding protein, partial [Streptomyces sp. NPDC048845]|uniref:GTP-binding protein n=1 Tax=Streptomyces sp. NPDC048845 TaxID=3155390 RepID=UPI00341C487C